MSINWATEPVPRNRLPYIPVRRLGPSGVFQGAITCHKPLACWCHFIGNRTLPCVENDCPGCTANRRKIRECYLSLYLTNERQQIITVLTPAAELALSDAAPDPANIRGLVTRITREGKRANGRIRCALNGDMISPQQLPPAPDLKAHMFVVWGLTPELLSAEHPLFEVRDQFTLPFEATNGDGLRKAK